LPGKTRHGEGLHDIAVGCFAESPHVPVDGPRAVDSSCDTLIADPVCSCSGNVKSKVSPVSVGMRQAREPLLAVFLRR
jgi:hypothetical protein